MHITQCFGNSIVDPTVSRNLHNTFNRVLFGIAFTPAARRASAHDHYGAWNGAERIVTVIFSSCGLGVAPSARSRFTTPSKRACSAAKTEDFRFHDLRHTFASHLVMHGVDLVTVKELLGHKTIITTNRYTPPLPKSRRRKQSQN